VGTTGNDSLGARIVAVRLPDGDTECWMTEAEFRLGQRLWCKGRPWLVAEVASARETGTHLRVSLREPESEAAAQIPIAPRTAQLTAAASEVGESGSADGERDRHAWNLPAPTMPRSMGT
jgi:hypothetical protein